MCAKKKHSDFRQILKSAFELKGDTFADAARKTRISPGSLSNKIHGRSDFNVSEMTDIHEEYGVPYEVFFNQELRKCATLQQKTKKEAKTWKK